MAQEITNGQFQSLLFDSGPSTFVRLDQQKKSSNSESSANGAKAFTPAPNEKFQQLLQGKIKS